MMAKVLNVEKKDPEVTVQFTLSELKQWNEYAKAYAQLPGGDWYLANMTDGLLDEAQAKR
jgi:hypothetical protein